MQGASKFKEAKDAGAVDDMNKFSKRTLRVTRQHAQVFLCCSALQCVALSCSGM